MTSSTRLTRGWRLTHFKRLQRGLGNLPEMCGVDIAKEMARLNGSSAATPTDVVTPPSPAAATSTGCGQTSDTPSSTGPLWLAGFVIMTARWRRRRTMQASPPDDSCA